MNTISQRRKVAKDFLFPVNLCDFTSEDGICRQHHIYGVIDLSLRQHVRHCFHGHDIYGISLILLRFTRGYLKNEILSH